MGKVMFGMSMSLDGFIAAPNDSPEHPLGEGGQRLQEWLSKVDADYAKVFNEAVKTCGAIIMGRRTYDFSATGGWWGDAGPLGQVPCFVLSHDVPEHVHAPAVFSFVTGGIESALALAKATAGHKFVGLMGANVQQQYLNAGLVDEIHINLIPMLFGQGTRLFEHLGGKPIELEQMRVMASPGVTHLGFRVIK